MTNPIPVNIAVEDALSEAVLRRLLAVSGAAWAIGSVYGRGGIGYLRKMIEGFNSAAQGTPFVVLADLDMKECAPTVIREWLPRGAHPNLILRFAVREVEAWLLADKDALAAFLGVSKASVPTDVEALDDPKRTLVAAARKARPDVRRDLVPQTGSTAVVGRNYNGRLQEYVVKSWRPSEARRSSDSLDRALSMLESFSPSW